MNHKSRSWCMVPEIWVQRTKLFVIFVMKYNRQNFFYLGLSFALVPPYHPPYQPQKRKFQKKEERIKRLEILLFYKSVPKIMIICHTVPEIRHMTDVIVIFYFGLIFTLLPPKQHEKLKLNKNEKNTWRYHHFTKVHQKSWSYTILFLRYGMWRMYLLFFILGYFLHF